MDGIKLVDQASKPPGKCLVSLDTTGPFVDTGMYAMHHNPYLYLSVRWIKEVAKNLLGMVPAEQVEARLAEFEAQIAEQAEKLALLEHFAKAAADYEQARDAVADVESPGDPGSERVVDPLSAEGRRVMKEVTDAGYMSLPAEECDILTVDDEAKVAAAPDVATVEAEADEKTEVSA